MGRPPHLRRARGGRLLRLGLRHGGGRAGLPASPVPDGAGRGSGRVRGQVRRFGLPLASLAACGGVAGGLGPDEPGAAAELSGLRGRGRAILGRAPRRAAGRDPQARALGSGGGLPLAAVDGLPSGRRLRGVPRGGGAARGGRDVADCYEIAGARPTPRRYLYDGKPTPIDARPVTVRVKGGAPVTRTLEYTRHNGVLSPVVARAGGKAYVVSTSFMHDAGLFDEEVYRMNFARNVGEVKQAMKLLGMFPQNVMVGDAEGGSFYLRAGKTPRRPAGFDWKRPVPGNTSRSAWNGYHPLEDLVQLE